MRSTTLASNSKHELRLDYAALKNGLSRKKVQLTLKRLVDILGALSLLIILAPLLTATALLVYFTSAGPVFFRQKRVGYQGIEFWFLKFRSMRLNMDGIQTESLSRAGILFKNQDDPRITPLGRFIRRWSIDEVPQLLNVLMGDMSLVGPRPLVPFMLDNLPDFKRARALVRPGLTGLWQIRDRANNTSAHFMIEHDLEYVRDFSLALDLKILLATPSGVMRGNGAV